jgi:thiamine biosynthesis lipoprotein
MGTSWQLEAAGSAPTLLLEAEAFVRAAEARYSRFLPDSLLSRLNRDRRVVDADFAELVCEAVAWRAATASAFDPAVGAALVAAGYDRSFEQLDGRLPPCAAAERAQPAIPVHGDLVALEGPGLLDLGGIAKGWTIDRVGALLAEGGARTYCVDGGGDLLLGGARDTEAVVELCTGGYRVGVMDGALASSSTLHRRWPVAGGTAHHIIDARLGAPATGRWVQCSVLARDATTADVLATALLADADAVLPALAAHGAQALLVSGDGSCMMTPGLAEYLR